MIITRVVDTLLSHLVDPDTGSIITSEVFSSNTACQSHLVKHSSLLLTDSRVDLPFLPDQES